MNKAIYNTGTLIASLVLMTGCGGGQLSFPADKKDNNVIKFQTSRATVVKSKGGSGELRNKCSMHTYLYLAARESLAHGYDYFVLSDPGHGWKYDNNMLGFPVTDSEAYERYCNPALGNPNTGLEDDKCINHPFGNPISTDYRGYITMMKTSTYLFPTWNARETMQKEAVKANACIDWSKYKKASSVKDIKIDY